MSELFGDGPVTQFADDLFLLDLRKIRGGTSAILDRLPGNSAGVYAWYRAIELPEPQTASPVDFAARIVSAATAPHCANREARLAPSHHVLVSPYQVISERKQRALASYCQSATFRSLLTQITNMSVLFQQPLYVGKAKDLSSRIAQHLASQSHLRERLHAAQIDIDSAKLLILTIDPKIYDELPTVELMDITEEESEEEDESTLPIELIMEEILSRLFLPSFTIRYG